jgi:myo-inositol 2-dehydrogenase / D-chiro-inositol 1-dehydrogenase
MQEVGARVPAICRIGFVGTGGVASRHARVLAALGGVHVVAVTDIDRDRATAFALEHGGLVVPDVAALLATGVDAVYVCVPPFAHGEPELALADAGVPMFVEKPLAANQAVAERIAERVVATSTLTRVGHHWRCAEPVRRARELLRGRQVRLVAGWWLDKVPPVPWWTDRRCSGGPLVEQAVHVLDLARVLVGEVSEVHAASAGPVAGGTTDSATAAMVRFADGPVGTLATSCVLAGKHRAGLEVVADGLVVGVGEDWLEVGDGVTSQRTTYDPALARTAADRAFLGILRGEPADPAALALPDHAEAMRSHRVACALARSVESGAPERVR